MAGRNVLIVAHANSLRGIVKHIDGLTTEQITDVGIPNGYAVCAIALCPCPSRPG
jgi:2,3-bisphosphoglycerate-dependent phosphoglycerate mutase